MPNPNLHINIDGVVASANRLAALPKVNKIRVSFWDADNNLIDSTDLYGLTNPEIRNRIYSWALKCPRAVYVLTEAYNTLNERFAGGEFLDGETVVVIQ